jgi:hypothetical protein
VLLGRLRHAEGLDQLPLRFFAAEGEDLSQCVALVVELGANRMASTTREAQSMTATS